VRLLVHRDDNVWIGVVVSLFLSLFVDGSGSKHTHTTTYAVNGRPGEDVGLLWVGIKQVRRKIEKRNKCVVTRRQGYIRRNRLVLGSGGDDDDDDGCRGLWRVMVVKRR
jgi:hypothetical protein